MPGRVYPAEVTHDSHQVLVEEAADQINGIRLEAAFVQPFLDGIEIVAEEFADSCTAESEIMPVSCTCWI